MVGRPVGVVTVEVVVLVPAPALRRLVEGREGAVVVVAAGRVRVEVTGRGRLVGRVRVGAAVVVVMVGGGGGGGSARACHGRERECIQGIVYIDRVGQIEIINVLLQLGTIHWSRQFGHHIRHAAEIPENRGGTHPRGREGRRRVHARG